MPQEMNKGKMKKMRTLNTQHKRFFLLSKVIKKMAFHDIFLQKVGRDSYYKEIKNKKVWCILCAIFE